MTYFLTVILTAAAVLLWHCCTSNRRAGRAVTDRNAALAAARLNGQRQARAEYERGRLEGYAACRADHAGHAYALSLVGYTSLKSPNGVRVPHEGAMCN